MHEHEPHATGTHSHAGHDHDHTRDAKPAQLAKALAITGCFLVVEVAGGILTGSLALLSDAAHMFTDTAALAIALTAVQLARMPPDTRRTFGYQRFEIIAAALNAVMLFCVALYILFEAYQRFLAPPQIKSIGMLVVAAIGLLANLVAMRVLFAGKDSDVNMRGAYLEVWSDMLGSLGVLLAAAVVWVSGWTVVDTLTAVGIGLWVLPRAWSLLGETVNVLLEGVPRGIDLAELADAIGAAPGVAGLHDLHVWALTSNQTSLSAHLVLTPGVDPDNVRMDVTRMLAMKFAIRHVTLQTEGVDCRTLAVPGVVH